LISFNDLPVHKTSGFVNDDGKLAAGHIAVSDDGDVVTIDPIQQNSAVNNKIRDLSCNKTMIWQLTNTNIM